MTATTLARTTDISRDQWLELRRQGIGSSDAAAVAGLNPWRSPLAVYLDKIGQSEEEEENLRMWLGREMEPIVAKRFAIETGIKVRRRNAILQHPDYPWMLANIDRELVGERAILECKTTGFFNREKWIDDETPDEYAIQVYHQLAVTGYNYGYIAVLIDNQEFVYKRIERDEDIIQNLIAIEQRFWEEHIVPRVPPSPIGYASDDTALLTMYPEAEDIEVELPVSLATLVDQYQRAHADEKDAKQRKDRAAQQIKAALGKHARGRVGDYRVRWAPVLSARFDTKRFKDDHPDLYEQYVTTSTIRRFGIA